ncbi:hypothetical protein RB195_005025 [Necator americanus]|uniref:Homeobox domain protein n=1 Tax=Necator americanus TaxID=51031 RepID=A0ABR1BP47_NECAM
MSSDFGVHQLLMPFDGNQPGPSRIMVESPTNTPPTTDPSDLLRLLSEGNGSSDSPKTHFERVLNSTVDLHDNTSSMALDGTGPFSLGMDLSMFGDLSGAGALRNSSKTLKCPKCNWHYKYQETLEIHMKEKHSDGEVKCGYCAENRVHPKLARGESYSCGYKPYRCELCKYSTTTKGNLSIHMQSDKHLHAVQELPSSIASLSCPPARSPPQDGDRSLVCVVCGCFTTDDLEEMIAHADKDRSRPSHGDISMSGGVFRCHLCPYHTNLKANFQLHTRTDKHLQRVQMVNHIREGTSASSALCRIGNAKTVFQVLCRPCQELLPSASSLRDHSESITHRTNLRQPITHYKCRLCSFDTPHKQDAIGHMTCHEPSTWPRNTIDFNATTMSEDAAYACASCGFTTKDAQMLEEHARSHEEGEQCPLCSDRTQKLTEHLIQEHKIAESAVERLLAVHRPEPSSSGNFTFRCGQCTMAFRSESALRSHSILHLFAPTQRCSLCQKSCSDDEELKAHMEAEHPQEDETSRCDLCAETFTSRASLIAHINSVRHLHRAKKQLEAQGSVDLSSQVLAALQSPPSPGEKKPFRCNVCKIGYGQGATLDIHLRSVAHQSRMSKIADLVSAGDVDPSKPVLEQPGGPAQKIIRELLGRDDEPSNAAQQQNVMTMFNIMNMLMGQNAGIQLPTFPTSQQQNSSGVNTPEAEEEVAAPRNAFGLVAMVKAFGEERLISASTSLAGKLSRMGEIPDASVEQLAAVDCLQCSERLPSILALSTHHEVAHSAAIPDSTVQLFAERLAEAIPDAPTQTNGHHPSPAASRAAKDDGEPPEKRPRSQANVADPSKPDLAQMAMLTMMGSFPFLPPNPLGGFVPGMGEFFNPLVAQQMQQLSSSPAKRARTRITDDQLKILRQYFDINNSPSESQIKEMSIKAGLPEKVIKHWFRNTLFKERQRDKDSPYNFSVPPQMGIDLDTYEKTGETKVVPLSNTESRREPSPKPAETPTVPPLNLQAMMQQMQHANPFQFMDPSGMIPGPMAQLSQTSTSGRRANRTRFTDYQLRTLQQFFDKQAYPKDDDLEVLSKKLQLSPRVIVVWFQNARQKARKIYENQPNHENADRFVRTPGCNFQCKRCNLVFQRYYELIQHQQKKCYKDDCLAQANDNKIVEESLTDEEKAQLIQQTALASINDAKPADLVKLLGASKSSTEALLKLCESANPSPSSFHKRCPFCGLLFRSKQALQEHIPARHPQQHSVTPLDVDLLPNAEDVPVLIPPPTPENKDLAGVLDLSSASQERDTLSMSPFLGQSDDDPSEFVEENPSSFGAGMTQSRSPTSNKRYRTHLTPTQVHVMKSVFGDYKTPSMTECEALGREIGLHKRVVQVWFQNARAKERKTRTASTSGEEEHTRSTSTSCTMCGVEYSGRVTMQDHLFSLQHLAVLKSQLRSDTGHADTPSSAFPSENGNERRPPTTRPNKTPVQPAQITSLNLNGFPFNFMNGIMSGGLPLVYDPAMFGTPVSMLQIPETVKLRIKSDITAGLSSSRFTQDGLSVDDLRQKLDSNDAQTLAEKEVEVGWACTSCTNVFQQEALLKNHQRSVCQGTEAVFTLVQIHYECNVCSCKVGTQAEYRSHCETAEHHTNVQTSTGSGGGPSAQ